MLIAIVPVYHYGFYLSGNEIPSGKEIMAMFNYEEWLNFNRLAAIMVNTIAFQAILIPLLILYVIHIFSTIYPQSTKSLMSKIF